MKTLTSSDISRISKRIFIENLNVSAGSGDEKKILIKKGLKIRHSDSGLVYTVIKIIIPKNDEGLKILCQRPGRELIIPQSEFKKYERQ